VDTGAGGAGLPGRAAAGGGGPASAAEEEMVVRGEGIGIRLTEWSTAVLCNSLGRYDQALAAAEQASADSRR
jgi:hypothetical protein